ncbi:MAG: glycoside hydrolase family 3 protein [Sphingobium sp.]|nr:glycoside hydrolase family 3 protein [Sphingobium sp.]
MAQTASMGDARQSDRPWMNRALTPEARVALLLPQMSRDEKISLMMSYFATDFPVKQFKAPQEARQGSAGYVAAIPRLGIPGQWLADAGIGVATQGGAAHKRERTALPSNLAVAATWNTETAFKGGAMIGGEARASGFNVMLAGGVNLEREPRNGRNFEYAGEDPLLAGTMIGAAVAGIQSNHIITTVKHFALNDQETDRNAGNAVIDHDGARLSDLFAFKLAIERGNPGSVMCSYNRVDGAYACESPWLLDEVLRKDWHYRGYVMSDWGATHSTEASLRAGLDQQSGYPFDTKQFYGSELKPAVESGQIGMDLIDRSVSRILYAMFEHGLFDHPITEAPMALSKELLDHGAAVTRAASAESMVLLKNDGNILPLTAKARKIVVIGGHADRGVLAGGGSSLVYSVGGNAVPEGMPKIWPGPVMYYPSSPLEALRKRFPDAQIIFVDGKDPAAAAQAARASDVAIVFATQWAGESFDVSLTLPDNQDALIESVASANPHTVVVIETGGSVLTPWRAKVPAILASWFPGTQGGEAIADILSGAVNPSGHLPTTFIDNLDQLPHPGPLPKGEFRYSEGSQVGYKWFDAKGLKPAFAFGHGLSYTSFTYTGLAVRNSASQVTVTFRVTNAGRVAGSDVPQIYVSGPGLDAPKRLAGFEKVKLAPGASASVSILIDPRMFADFKRAQGMTRIAGGTYQVHLAHSAANIVASAPVHLAAQALALDY